MSASQEIRERLAARDRFRLAEVRRWMADESDLELWSAAYQLLGSGWKLIHPKPDMDETCAFMTTFLLRCIRANVEIDDSNIPTGFEAAHHLASCMKHWASKLPETESVLTSAAQKITASYLAGTVAEQNRLLNGMLEHALEAESVRPYFDHWKCDPLLGQPWRLAMEWATTHDDPNGN